MSHRSTTSGNKQGLIYMSEFGGKVAIVTGSSSGIGEAIARSLHALGASVVINSSSSVEALSLIHI